MSAICHVSFEQTAIAALIALAFAAVIVAALSVVQARLVERKLDRVMNAMRLDPASVETFTPSWFTKIRKAIAP